jgi:predicted secreted protein
MDKFTFFITMILAMCFTLTACASLGVTSDPKTVVITPAIKGNSAILAVGDSLELRIPTIPKAGFEWQVEDLDTAILEQEGTGIYTKDPDTNSAGGIVTFQFTAIGKGKTTIHLLFVSPSVGEAPALSSNSFSVVVEVR